MSDESYEVTIRVTVRDARTSAKVGPDALAAFEVDRRVMPSVIGEAAVDAARSVASGFGRPAVVLTKLKLGFRGLARSPHVQRGVAVVSAVLREGATSLEREASQAAARIVNTQETPDE